MSDVRIVPFDATHRAAFERLNRAWLVDHDLLEPADEPQLGDPVGSIVARRGAIFVALHEDQIVGTAALLPHAAGEMELAKLTVDARMRGQGIGRRLVAACVDEARSRSCDRLVLVSSSRLQPALRLYESLGFVHGPLPDPPPYESADIYMELPLGGEMGVSRAENGPQSPARN